MTRSTLNQVALQAGVSKTTASLVLNGKADSVNIAQSTRSRVLETAKALNYHPAKFNPVRLNGKSGIIGLFSADFTSLNYSQWLQALITKAEEKEYVLLPKLATPMSMKEKIAAVPFDSGIILQPDLINHKSKMATADFPLICAGFIPNSETYNYIAPDFPRQTNELIQTLYRHNKKAIGYLTGNQDTKENLLKTTTYKENYCERFDIMPNIAELSSPELNPKEIKEACLRLIKNGANAIILETPEMAYSA
ncbi:LacI family DNA-binding transcriptional regulator [Marinilabilia salmonicolor]|nr:LacI family DNA-binding transcriptional regulator [Marinilabilia salmonicolor]